MDIFSFWGENHPFGSSWPGTHLKNWSRQFNSGISHLQLCHHWQQHIKRKCLELTWWVLSMENEEEATMVKEEKKRRRRRRNLPVVNTKMITFWLDWCLVWNWTNRLEFKNRPSLKSGKLSLFHPNRDHPRISGSTECPIFDSSVQELGITPRKRNIYEDLKI